MTHCIGFQVTFSTLCQFNVSMKSHIVSVSLLLHIHNQIYLDCMVLKCNLSIKMLPYILTQDFGVLVSGLLVS